MLWRNTSGYIIVDGSGHAVDCAVCPCGHTVDCNPSPIPTDLPLVFTWNCTQFSVTVSFGPFGPGGTDGWAYTGADIDVYDGLRFRAFSLWCAGGSWVGEFVYTQRNAGGTYIQQSVQTGAGLSSATIVSTNPLCLFFTGSASVIDGGSFDYYFAVGPGCSVIPLCCDWSGSPSTATVSFNINSGAVVGSFSIPKVSSTSYSGFGADCDLGDGHNVIRFSAAFSCALFNPCEWLCSMTIRQETDGVATRVVQWTTGLIKAGKIGRVATGSGFNNFAINCSPTHLHYEGVNNGINTSGASVTCGGKTYPFGANGTVNCVWDIVTP